MSSNTTTTTTTPEQFIDKELRDTVETINSIIKRCWNAAHIKRRLTNIPIVCHGKVGKCKLDATG